MGNLSDNIEDRDVAPISMDYEPLPAGKYKAQITNSEVKPTSTGGLMLKLTWDILDKEYQGRKVFGQLNIVNASEKAQQIGRGQLSSLSIACGKLGIPEDSIELHEIPHVIKLAIEESAGYAPKNTVKGFFGLDGKTVEKKDPPKKVGNVDIVQAEDDFVPDFLK